MRFKEFLGSGPAGLVAGALTVVLGGGAVAAIAFGGSAPTPPPIGDPRLSSGEQAFDAALVANAGANDPSRVARTGSGMADGSPVAGPASSPAGDAAAARAVAPAAATDAREEGASTAANRPGSAAYYRAILSAGAGGAGLGTMAMLPRGAYGRGGHLAGNLGRSGEPGLVGDGAAAARDPLVPSRAFSSYGSNDAGSSAATSSGSKAKAASNKPAIGTAPVGPASGGSAPAARPSTPSTFAAPPSNIGSNHGSSSGSLVSSAPPVATDPLGEHAVPAPSGHPANQPATPPSSTPGTPGAKPAPPTTSVVGPDAIVTPEPGTWLLVGSGLLALGVVGRRRAGQKG